jgi:ribosome biogenesis GTPase A
VGNKPGVTKGKQWIKINKNVELLDTPGILWPKFEDDTVGEHLAFIGSINDEILQKTELCCDLIQFLKEYYPGTLAERYQVDEESESADMLAGIAKNRGCLLKGNELNYEKAAGILLDEFRNGKLGRISLEQPE